MKWLRPAPLVMLTACGWLVGPPGSAAPSPAAATTTTARHVAPEPTDVRPAAPGSAAGSAAARPFWSPSLSYAPAVAWVDARDLFERGETEPRSPHELRGDLLACAVTVEFEEIKDWSLRPSRWKDADLMVFFSFGVPQERRKRDGLRARGPDQSNVTWIAAPFVGLRAGDPIEVLLNDRDRLLDLDYVARVTSTYDGATPLHLRGDHAAVECRVVLPAAVDEVLHERLWELDDQLLVWSQSDPDAPPDYTLKQAFERAAGLVGWDDERITRRMGMAAAIEQQHREARARRFAEVAAAAPRPGAPVELRGVDLGVRVGELICDRATVARLEADLGRIDGVDPCVITIEVANRGASRQIWPNRGPDARWDWWVFDARGRAMGLRWVERGPMTLPAGETLELHAITGSADDGDRWFSAPDGVRAAPAILQISENRDPRRRLRLALR